MNKIEDYINEHFDGDKLKHIAETFGMPAPEYADDSGPPNATPIRTGMLRISIGDDLRQRLRSLDDEARKKIEEAIARQMTDRSNEAIRKAYGMSSPPLEPKPLTLEAFSAVLRDHIERQREIERQVADLRQRLLMRPDGEAFVARVDHFAEANGVEWVDAARICAIADFREATIVSWRQIEAFLTSPAMQEAIKSITAAFAGMVEQMTKGIAEAVGDVLPPRNRRERRAAKHTKPISPKDQTWKPKNRDYRNHRNR